MKQRNFIWVGKVKTLAVSVVNLVVVLFLGITCINLLVCSCSGEDADLGGKPQRMNLSRKYFASEAELDAFISSFDGSESTNKSSNESEQTIMEALRENTAIGSILNDNLEFEVGDTIYKYAPDGYTMYAIEKSAYNNAYKYFGQEAAIIARLSSYAKVNEGVYRLEDGVLLYYTGEPVFEYISSSSYVPTRISQDGLTKVQAAFWKSHSVIKSSCGVKVEAWARNNVEEDFQSFETDLQLQWNIRFTMVNAPAAPSSGSLIGHGSVLKKELYWSTGYFTYNLVAPSVIEGKAKCKDGSWISAAVTKK